MTQANPLLPPSLPTLPPTVLQWLSHKPWRLHPLAMANHLTRGRFRWARHLERISEILARVQAGKPVRMILQVPVRHGKSWLASWWFPVWFLERFPHKRIILASYEASFAASWGRRVRNTLQEHESELSVRIAGDASAADNWETTKGGGMTTAGVGGPITGKGADVLLVDDPVKNFEEANSETYREKTWDWWQSVAYTRLEPGGSAIVTMARWHDDDLTGRILREMNGGGEHWDVVSFPAIAESGDELGRKPGEALWPQRYDETALDRIRRAVGSYTWSSLYQQRPNPEGGGKFKRAWFRYFTDEGDHFNLDGRRYHKSTCWTFATADLALSTKEDADYTAIGIWTVTPHSDLILREVIRMQAEAPDVEAELRKIPDRWDTRFVGVEKAHYGAAVIQNMNRSGFAIKELIADKDKVTRSLPVAVRMESGRVWFRKGAEYLDEYERELLGFPKAAHDDQVDMTSYAAIAVRTGDKWLEPDSIVDPLGGLSTGFSSMNESE